MNLVFLLSLATKSFDDVYFLFMWLSLVEVMVLEAEDRV